MTTVINEIINYFKYILEDLSDPRTKDWFLIGPPWIILVLELAYIGFVYYIGPAFMANRQPYRIKKMLVVYNIGQIIINLYICSEGFKFGWLGHYKFICQGVDYSSEGLQTARIVWLYYITKLLDLVDTGFCILEKKYHKITFLHVYHHGGMIIAAWICTRYFPGGHVTFLGLINSMVHVIMYSHYLWTALNLSKPWWKKYLTQLQIFQFAVIFIHYLIAVLTEDCAFPKWPLALFLPQNLFMTLLFLDFYYKTYIKKKSTSLDQNNVLKKAESKQNGVEYSNGKSKKH